MLFSLRMAWAYFSKIWFRGVWGVMIIISTIGISLGVASLVVTLSVMNGFHTEITSKLLSLNPHVLIMNPFIGIELESRIKDKIEDLKQLKSYSSFLYGKGLLYHSNNSHGVVVKGIKPDNGQIKLTDGTWDELDKDGVVLGREIVNILNLELGDDVFLIIPQIEQIGAPVIPRVEKFVLKGIYNSGIYEYDSSLIYIDIDLAREIFSDVSYTAGVELYLDNPFNADKSADELREKLKGSYYNIQTWKDRNYNLFAALKLEKAMMFIVLIMIVLVATFNIAGTLIMISITRSKDCGIMRAIGATKRQIRMMFNFKGLLIGATGTALGTIIGLILGMLLKKYQFIHLPPKVYLISTLPVKVDPGDILLITLTALLISYLSTIYPSHRAGKLGVAEELRSE